MTEASDKKAQRAAKPEFRNIHALKDLPHYRLPPAGIVSILHRISGALLFLALPLLIWLFEMSVRSELSFGQFEAILEYEIWGLPIVKLILLVLFWAYMHHLIAGLRHLWMDACHKVDKAFGDKSAKVTLALSLLLTLIFAFKLFAPEQWAKLFA